MGFFSKIFGKKEEKPEIKEIYLQFAKIISGNDENVLAKVRYLFENTQAFLAEYKELYFNRGINTEQISKEDLYWISLADILIADNYAIEFDVSGELEDFEYFVKDLQGFKLYPSIDFPELDESGAVYLWIEQVNEYWKDQPIVLMQQDIDSDSHVVFLIKKEHMQFLQTESKKLGKEFY